MKYIIKGGIFYGQVFALERKYQLILLAFILIFLVSSGYLTGKTLKAYRGGRDNYTVDTLEIENSNNGIEAKGKLIVNIKGLYLLAFIFIYRFCC